MTDRLDQLFSLLKLERPKGVDPILALKLDIERLMDTERRWAEACSLARVHCPVGDGESHIRQGIPRMADRIRELEQRLERVGVLRDRLRHRAEQSGLHAYAWAYEKLDAALTPPPEQECNLTACGCPSGRPGVCGWCKSKREQPATPPEQAPCSALDPRTADRRFVWEPFAPERPPTPRDGASCAEQPATGAKCPECLVHGRLDEQDGLFRNVACMAAAYECTCEGTGQQPTPAEEK